MNAVAADKPRASNRLEGFALTAICQGMPIFVAAALLIRLFAHSEPVGHPGGGGAVFVVTASVLHALVIQWLGPKFPGFFKSQYEPLFFDGSLSFSEKLFRWRIQPVAALQLLTQLLMLSVLALAVLSAG